MTACACAWEMKAGNLTDCNVERGRLEGLNRNEVCRNDCEGMAIDSNVDPVVDARVYEAKSVGLSWSQSRDCILAAKA
jgi:hypothetical protein